MSGNGNYVVAVGTGFGVYFWNNTLSIPDGSFDVDPDYTNFDSPDPLEYVDISWNGSVVVVAGSDTLMAFIGLPRTLTPSIFTAPIGGCYVGGARRIKRWLSFCICMRIT